MTARRRFESPHRFKTLRLRKKIGDWFGGHQVVFDGTASESFSLREIRHDVSLRRSQRPRLLRPARIKVRGGRANRRRCARWRRFPSDCRILTHSNMGAGVLCRNFSGETHASRPLWTREIRIGPPTASKARHASGVKERAGRSGVTTGRVKLQASPIEFEYIWNDDLPWVVTVRGGGRMSYEVITFFNLDPFSNDTVLRPWVCTRPPSRAPDRPLSTR